jgi:hypothetical protein
VHRASSVVCLLALALLPATALASARRACRYESYPAANWRAVTPAEQSALNRVIFGHDNVDSMLAAWKTDPPSQWPPVEALNLEISWAAVDAHPGLSLLFPNALMLRRDRYFIGVVSDVVALFGGRLYHRDSFNRLLRAAGSTGVPRDVERCAQAAVLWGLLQQQAELHDEPGPYPKIQLRDLVELSTPIVRQADSVACATALPAVAFDPVGRLRPFAPADRYRECVVACHVAGLPASYRVVFEGDDVNRVLVGAAGDSLLVAFSSLVLPGVEH